MARFDVYPLRASGSLVVDCQADLLSGLSTRLVAPLVPAAEAPPPISRLNPVVTVGERQLVMMTQFAAAIDLRELGPRVASLATDETRLVNALDMLISGV